MNIAGERLALGGHWDQLHMSNLNWASLIADAAPSWLMGFDKGRQESFTLFLYLQLFYGYSSPGVHELNRSFDVFAFRLNPSTSNALR